MSSGNRKCEEEEEDTIDLGGNIMPDDDAPPASYFRSKEDTNAAGKKLLLSFSPSSSFGPTKQCLLYMGGKRGLGKLSGLFWAGLRFFPFFSFSLFVAEMRERRGREKIQRYFRHRFST